MVIAMKKRIMVIILFFLLSGCSVNNPIPDVIEDEVSPNVYGIEDIEIENGSRFDPLDGVSAYDVQDGYITSNIQVEGRVDTSVYGVYLVKYRVSDSDDNQTLVLRYVTVERNLDTSENLFPFGEMNNQLQGFDIYVEPGTGDANFYTQDGVMVIEILNIEQGKWYCPRLSTVGVTFEQGSEYMIQFDAKALEERLIQVQVGELLTSEPWFDKFDAYANTFTIATEWTTFDYTFTMAKDTNDSGNILFELGEVAGDATITTVYLDNIKILKLT